MSQQIAECEGGDPNVIKMNEGAVESIGRNTAAVESAVGSLYRNTTDTNVCIRNDAQVTGVSSAALMSILPDNGEASHEDKCAAKLDSLSMFE